MIAGLTALFFVCLLLGAAAYFLSGWIGRRMRPGVHAAVPYALTLAVIVAGLRVDGPDPIASIAPILIGGVAIGLAALDRARRGVSVFAGDLTRPLPEGSPAR